MSRSGRALCTLYTAVTLWITWCTVRTFGHVPLWTSITMAAASIAPICAGLRESSHADELRALRVQLERAARPAVVRPVISQEERAAFDELVAGLGMDDAA